MRRALATSAASPRAHTRAHARTTDYRPRPYSHPRSHPHCDADSGVGVVLEIKQGMVDRGADLRWLSMYPFESEVTFAPLAGLEVQSTRVQGGVLIVEVRLSVNLSERPIEQVL